MTVTVRYTVLDDLGNSMVLETVVSVPPVSLTAVVDAFADAAKRLKEMT